MILGGTFGPTHTDGTVVAEVDPGISVEPAGDALKQLADKLRRAVGRSGVADYPMGDNRFDRFEAASDDRRLVLNDHHEADGFIHLGSTG